MSRKSGELPKGRKLWRVRGAIEREGGHVKDETTEPMTALAEWRERGVKDAEVIVDEVAAKPYLSRFSDAGSAA